MIEVKNNLRLLPSEFLCILDGSLCHIAEESLVCIVAGTLGNLENNWRLCFSAGLNDSLKLLHIVEVECRDGVAALYCLGEHLTGVHKAKILK